jgi:hypothetical protein
MIGPLSSVGQGVAAGDAAKAEPRNDKGAPKHPFAGKRSCFVDQQPFGWWLTLAMLVVHGHWPWASRVRVTV